MMKTFPPHLSCSLADVVVVVDEGCEWSNYVIILREIVISSR